MFFGAGDEVRTHDLLVGNETHYHCATPANSKDIISSYDFVVNTKSARAQALFCLRGGGISLLVLARFRFQDHVGVRLVGDLGVPRVGGLCRLVLRT